MSNEIINYYNNYNEDIRLFRSNRHKIEWLTTLSYFKKVFKDSSYILDGCAGTGNYAFELVEWGHKVIASDIVPHNVDIIKQKQEKNPILEDICVGDISNLSRYDNNMFDAVLCMGAFYHMSKETRKKAMEECLRVLRADGILVITYINNIASTVFSLGENLENIDKAILGYNKKTQDDMFSCMTPDEIEELAKEHSIKMISHIGADGIFYLNYDKINGASEENFEKFMKLHLEICEDRSILGYSLHGLVILRK